LKPKIFVGSSVEGLKIAEGIIANLDYAARAVAWHLTFPVSEMTIDSLLKEFESQDFAIFVFSPDDVTTMREKQVSVARDNVLFEAGLFMGMHGRNRVFIVTPRGTESALHMPTDLFGYTTAVYDHDWAKTEPTRAGQSPASQIKQALEQSDWAQQRLDIVQKKVTNEQSDNITYKMKLHFKVANNTRWPVLVQSIDFDFEKQTPSNLDNVYGKGGAKVHKPEFHLGKLHDGKRDHYSSACYLEPEESCYAWVAYDPSDDPEALHARLNGLAKGNKLGTWTYTCAWDGRPPRTYHEKM
jgi:hypothetical protein